MTRSGARQLMLLALLAAVWPAQAQDAQVRATLADTGPVWVGERVTVRVDLLVPGYFASSPSFNIPDPAGVLLMPPQGHPLVRNETIDGVLYSVQQHELWAWPMRTGDQAVPPVTVRLRFKRNPLDTDSVPASLETPALSFDVKVPAGAERLGTVISARDVEVSESWDPEPGEDAVPAGKAYIRTVTFTAPDVPGMVFPPFPAGDIDGLGIYTKQQLADSEDRGSLTGRRSDRVTYVAKRPGQYAIPAVRFAWYDLDANELKTVDLPAHTLNVVANPAMSAASGTATNPSPTARWRVWAAGLAALLLIIFAALSRRVRTFVARVMAPYYPVHLQALNPVLGTGKEQP